MSEMRIIESNNNCIQPKRMNSSSCNICRNHKNISDPSHRQSKMHQRNLNEKFSIIRAKIKEIKPSNIIIHDEDWNPDDAIFCYFCHESLQKHAVYDGVAVEYLGYLNHLASSSHQTKVIQYLKYHGRREDYKVFCKAPCFLQTFTSGIEEAKKKYEIELNALNKKDVLKIKNIEAERKKVLESDFQEEPNTLTSVSLPIASINNERCSKTDIKIPPWLIVNQPESAELAETSSPIIGPTLETLHSHLKKKKRKSLPPKRLQKFLNKKQNKVNRRWLPPFSGVWSKGRTRKLK